MPGSIIASARRDEARAAIVGQIARALAIFSVDEIVIFDDTPSSRTGKVANIDPESYTGEIDPCGYIQHLLTYLDVPPFMRKALMPMHPNLKAANNLPNLEIPSHPHPNDALPYREGYTLPKKGGATMVDIGSQPPIRIEDDIPPNTRITLKMSQDGTPRGEPCSPEAPRTEGGLYWGYTVRRCTSLSSVFEECAYEGGYDLSVGTSERGVLLSEALPERKVKEARGFNHMLVVFGGPRGLEHAAENDPALAEMGIIRGRTKELFDYWINILPWQGCRTIRTEEALMISLTGLGRLWDGRE
jgi:methyltransferase